MAVSTAIIDQVAIDLVNYFIITCLPAYNCPDAKISSLGVGAKVTVGALSVPGTCASAIVKVPEI